MLAPLAILRYCLKQILFYGISKSIATFMRNIVVFIYICIYIVVYIYIYTYT